MEACWLDRFKLQRVLGEGGMGIVYSAHDQERGVDVALKTLREIDPKSLLRFKNEFRALTSIAHRNLVALYELLVEGENWFFTMELVDGPDFISFVRRKQAPTVRTSAVTATLDPAPVNEPSSGFTGGTVPAIPRPAPYFDYDRLRSALLEVVDAVEALHAAGYLHRDLKPSNILVGPEPRVVVMDFGILTTLRADTGDRERYVAGTPAYMAPEQARGEVGDRASDWYSVGVMLYQVLTDSMPFRGSSMSILERKQQLDPPHPGRMFGDVPPVLADLCMRLLDRDPQKRANGNDVREAFNRRRKRRLSVDEAVGVTTRLVGRDKERAALLDACKRSARELTIAVVSGESGMGKSTLLSDFTREAAASGALVLGGRCYEKESVPYKAVDELVDGLTRYLLELSPIERQRLIVPGCAALMQVFPVLGQVPEVAAIPRPIVADLHELRSNAFVAFRLLVRALSARRPMILVVDDLQWADADSVAVFRELCSVPVAGVCVIFAHRKTGDGRPIPFLERLLAVVRMPPGTLVNVEVAPLTKEAARLLAPELVEQGELPEGHQIALEGAGGNPFFILELARFARTGGKLRGPLTVLELVESRIRDLPAAARRVMEYVSIASQPLPQAVIWRAADVDPEERGRLCQFLRAAHLVQLGGARSADVIWTYHAKVGDAVQQALPESVLPGMHLRLAEALEEQGFNDPEMLSAHYGAAGETQRAAALALRAAERATHSLAFDHAVTLFSRALKLGSWDAANLCTIHTTTGECLANSGRAPEAATAFLEAAQVADEEARLELKRRAAEQYLQGGHFDQGRELMREILQAAGETFAKKPAVAIASLLVRRWSLRFRRFEIKPQPETPDLRVTSRLDALWAGCTGMTTSDPLLGAELLSRFTVAAIKLGEAGRLARAVSMQATYSGLNGEAARQAVDLLNDTALAIALRSGDPAVLGHVTACRGATSQLRGDWGHARTYCEEGERILREVKGSHWEKTTAQLYLLGALFYLGEIGLLRAELPQRLREAEDKGNLYAATALRSWRTNAVWLARGDPGEARRQMAIADEQWSRHRVKVQEYYRVTSLGRIDLYERQPEAAIQRMDETWVWLKRAMLMRVQNVRIECFHHRASYHLALGGQRGDTSEASRAEADARRILAEGVGWSRGMGQLVMAGVWWLRGEKERTLGALGQAEAAFRGNAMKLYAAAAQARAAQVRGDDVGPAREAVLATGVDCPERMIAVLAPGFPDLD